MGSKDTSPKTVFRAFVITDIVGSTDLKQRMGDAAYAEAIARHDELFQSCLAEVGGSEPKDIGDGFLASFEVPSNAVGCALRFQKGLADLRAPEPLKVRIGVHVGEIVLLDASDSTTKEPKQVGLAIDSYSRTPLIDRFRFCCDDSRRQRDDRNQCDQGE